MSKNRIQTPLAKARGLGSAHEGVHHWLMERLTSVALIPLVAWLVYSILALRGASYETFTAWLAAPLNAILMILFILIGFYHAVLGSQVIVEDYIHNKTFKMIKLIGIKLFFFVVGVACVFSVLKIAFGG